MRFTTLSLLFLLLAGFSLCADWEKGEAYLASGNLDRAYGSFIYIAHSDLDALVQGEAYARAAHVLFVQGKTEKTRSLLRLSMNFNPTLDLGSWATASGFSQLLNEVKMSAPIDLKSNLQMAESKFHDGLFDSCKTDLLSMISRGYAFTEVYKLLADILVQQGKFSEAHAAYKNARDAEPFLSQERANDPAFRLSRALEAYGEGDYEKALQLLPEEDSSNTILSFRLSLFAHLKKYDKLLAYLASHPEFRRSNREFGLIYSSLLTSMDLLDEAKEEFTGLVQLDRFWVEPRLALARIYWKSKNPDLASTYYSQVILLEPTNPSHLTEHGIFLITQNKIEEAKERLSAAYQFATGDPSADKLIPWYALTLYSTGDHGKAQSILNSYLTSSPSDIWAKNLLALSYFASDNSEACIQEIEGLSGDDSRRILARCYYDRKRLKDSLTTAEAISDRDVDTTQDLAIILMENHRAEEGLNLLLSTRGIAEDVSAAADRVLKAIQAMK